jgi:hypothetical protein
VKRCSATQPVTQSADSPRHQCDAEPAVTPQPTAAKRLPTILPNSSSSRSLSDTNNDALQYEEVNNDFTMDGRSMVVPQRSADRSNNTPFYAELFHSGSPDVPCRDTNQYEPLDKVDVASVKENPNCAYARIDTIRRETEV